MQIKVTPTRMELLRIRRRQQMAKRGHRLLEEKLEGLVQQFMLLVEEYRALRVEVDRELPRTMKRFLMAGSESGHEATVAALESLNGRLVLEPKPRRMMGVEVLTFEVGKLEVEPAYSLVETTPTFDAAVTGLQDLLPKVVKLAGLEEAVRRLAAEIEKTRRRVNALEYVVIPQLAATRKAIASKLDEMERGARARLLKIKPKGAE